MLKFILPGDLKKTKISFKTTFLCDCSYNPDSDTVHINRKRLLKSTDITETINIYLNKKLTNKELIIFCLLHELGHKKLEIEGNTNFNLYIQQQKKLIASDNLVERHISYWNNVDEEKKAMDFAKEYFQKYQDLEKK